MSSASERANLIGDGHNGAHDARRQRVERRFKVLRAVMALRYRALLGSARIDQALARHDAFLASSDSYRDCFARGDERVRGRGGDRVAIGGLDWWVPPDMRLKGGTADRMVRKRWLPLSDILSARELAVGTAMLDIGANIGTTSIPRAVLGDVQYVYAAEPDPLNYDFLVHNVVANALAGFVLPDRVAIGAADEEAMLRVSSKMTNHMLAAEGSSDRAGQVKVRCRTLDSWVREHGIDLHDVAFIKCDTQGWEGYVLRGATEVLRHKHIAWQLEIWPKGLQKAGFDCRELYDLIRTHFTHFVDLSTDRQARYHTRRTIKLEAELTDSAADRRRIRDLVVFNASG